jgi:CRISPR-associated protein (TIGR03986 family)
MMTITSPFNFVPFANANEVFFPDETWVQASSQDMPLPDGMCGEISFELIARGPVLVSGTTQAELPTATFFKTPDGTPAIPGSSLRGMIRHVMKIVTLGKLSDMDDQQLAMRDLHAKAYRDRLTTTTGQNVYTPKSKGGWLEFTEGEWRLTPCEYSRVEHDDLSTLVPAGRFASFREPKTTAPGKYDLWEKWKLPLPIAFINAAPVPHTRARGISLYFAKATNLCAIGRKTSNHTTEGTLVFTGQPSPQKHMEFIFHSGAEASIIVSPIMVSFLNIYSDSEDWKKHWRPQINRGKRIPVFWLPDEQDKGQVKYIGLSQMFKIPYLKSLRAALPDAHNKPEPDFTELLFGRLVDKPDSKGWQGKGRIDFSLATLQNPKEEYEEESYTVAASQPKASYYPFYLKQPGTMGELPIQGYVNDRPQYKPYQTLMANVPQLRGYKRYQARMADQPQPALQADNQNILTTLKPIIGNNIDKPLRFHGILRFHNVRPQELGALLWALKLNPESWTDCPYWHSLGMGKPLGFGAVQFKVTDMTWRENATLVKQNGLSEIPAWVESFESLMRKSSPAWGIQHPCIKNLLALACYQTANLGIFRYMPLAGFADIKRGKRYFLSEPADIVALPKAPPRQPSPHKFDESDTLLALERLMADARNNNTATHKDKINSWLRKAHAEQPAMDEARQGQLRTLAEAASKLENNKISQIARKILNAPNGG